MSEFLFSKTEQALLDLLANSMFHSGRSLSVVAEDWDYIWHESYVQAVPLVAFSGEFHHSVPAEVSAHIKVKVGEIVSSVSRRIGEHIFIHRLLTSAGIRYTIIKGFACSLYYNDPLLRWLGDVDFLVEPSDEEVTAQLLVDNGFKEFKTIGESHRVFYFKGCRYEMHTEPAGIPNGDVGDIVRQYTRDTVGTSCLAETVFGQVNVPDDFHHGLIILLHIAHHLNGEGIGLRHLCDWAVFVSRLERARFCELFEKPLKEMGLWQFAALLTEVCVDYLGCDEAILIQRETEVATSELMQDLLAGGNLGQKSDDRAHEALLLSSENSNDSLLKNLFLSANRAVYKNWPVCRRLKLLLPLGWLFFGIRYVLRSLKGERPQIDLKNIKKEVSQRKGLYSRLRLFESEYN